MLNSELVPKIHDVFMTNDQFHVGLCKDGIVQLSFGAISVNLSFDAANDLLFQLAEFISVVDHGGGSEKLSPSDDRSRRFRRLDS